MSLRRFAPVILVVGLVAAACGSSGSEDNVEQEDVKGEPNPVAEASGDGGFAAQDGDVVDVHYVGTLDDGSQFDSSRDRGQAFTFTVGSGQVISGFDEAVRGARVGDVNTVRMEPADAYGEWSEDNVIQVPFNPQQGDVQVGDEVYLTNGQPAVVLEVTEEYVKLDANHRLAGEALTFEIEVLSITRP